MKLGIMLYDVALASMLAESVRSAFVLTEIYKFYVQPFQPKVAPYLKTNPDIVKYSASLIQDSRVDIRTDANKFLQQHAKNVRKVIATPYEKNAVPLDGFTFNDRDLIIFGNELNGLPKTIERMGDERVFIPQVSRSRQTRQGLKQDLCLTLASAVTCVAYEHGRQNRFLEV